MTCALSWREPSVRLGLRNDSGPEMIASVQSSHISAHVGHFSTPLKSLSDSVAKWLPFANLTRAKLSEIHFPKSSFRTVRCAPTFCFVRKEKGSHESIRKAFHTENCRGTAPVPPHFHLVVMLILIVHGHTIILSPRPTRVCVLAPCRCVSRVQNYSNSNEYTEYFVGIVTFTHPATVPRPASRVGA